MKAKNYSSRLCFGGTDDDRGSSRLYINEKFPPTCVHVRLSPCVELSCLETPGLYYKRSGIHSSILG